MGLFYKIRYRCKKCGQTYSELPTYCSCGTNLSFICPCNIWNVNTEFQPSINCEEIKQSIFFFGKKQRIEELENKAKYLENELMDKQQEIKDFRNEKIKGDGELRKIQYRIEYLERENSNLEQINSRLNMLVEHYKQMQKIENNISIPQGTIEAVKYAMKKSHPDNGGNAEDFVRFQKAYKELTRK